MNYVPRAAHAVLGMIQQREKLGMQETLSLNWSRERAVIDCIWRLPFEEQKPFIPVIRGKKGGRAQGKMLALLCWPGGEEFV